MELVKEKVRMPSPVHSERHASPPVELSTWSSVYEAYSRNVKAFDNSTVHLDANNELQPDMLIRKIDGACRLEENDYFRWSPEIVAEISNTSWRIDLNDKKDVYEMCGVKEYIIWHTRVNEIKWVVFRNGNYHRLEPVDGLVRSETFLGLVLNVTAMLDRNTSKVIETLMVAINEQKGI